MQSRSIAFQYPQLTEMFYAQMLALIMLRRAGAMRLRNSSHRLNRNSAVVFYLNGEWNRIVDM